MSRFASSLLCVRSICRSSSTPCSSMRSSTGTSGCSMSSYSVLSAGTAEICGHSTWCSRSVTSESSAEYSAALSTDTWLNGICFAPLPATSS